MICTGGLPIVAGHLVHALGEADHEAQLGDVAHLRLVVAVEVRGRLPPLVARDFDVAVDEHVLPRHEHVVEHDVAVGLVEAARQRIVERIGGAERERPARIELDARRVDRDRDAVGVVLVARLQRMDAAQMDVVGDRAGGGQLLRAGDDDAVVALLDHAGIKRRIALLVRGLAAVDLRRHDRVARLRCSSRMCS